MVKVGRDGKGARVAVGAVAAAEEAEIAAAAEEIAAAAAEVAAEVAAGRRRGSGSAGSGNAGSGGAAPVPRQEPS